MPVRPRWTLPALALCLAFLAAPPPALEAQGSIAQIVRVTAVQGHRTALEEGMKRYWEDAEEAGVDAPWLVWDIVAAGDPGDFYVATFGHPWSYFDTQPDDPTRLGQSFLLNIAPHVADADVGYWTYREDLAHEPPPEGEPTAYSLIYLVHPAYGHAPATEAGFRAVKESAVATGWSGEYGIYQLVAGGRVPAYAISVPAESFADMEPPSPTLEEMVAQHMGEDDATEMFEEWGASLALQMSEIIAYRSDLSLWPDGM